LLCSFLNFARCAVLAEELDQEITMQIVEVLWECASNLEFCSISQPVALRCRPFPPVQ
jgi:hypothetical protein